MTHARRRGILAGVLLAGLTGACAATPPVATEPVAENGAAGSVASGNAASGNAASGNAAAAIEPAPELRPSGRQTYLSLGRRLLEANEPALAMRAFNNSLSAEGITPEALTGAGIAAQRQGMLGTSREYLDYARALAPNSAIAHRNLGVVLLGLRDYHGARTALRSALLLAGTEGDAAARRYLEQAETEIAAREAGRHGDPAATQRVVRLGSDAFRLTEKTVADGGHVPIGTGATVAATAFAGETTAAAATGPAPATEDAATGDAAGDDPRGGQTGSSEQGAGAAGAADPAAGDAGSRTGDPIETAGLAAPVGKGATNGTD